MATIILIIEIASMTVIQVSPYSNGLLEFPKGFSETLSNLSTKSEFLTLGEEQKNMVLHLTEDDLADIDQLALKHNLSREEAIKQAISAFRKAYMEYIADRN